MGKYPIESVRMMDRIVRETERHSGPQTKRHLRTRHELPLSFPDAIAEAAGRVANDVQAAAIIAFTQSGFTAQLIAKYRPSTPIYAFTSKERVQRRLCLHWGIRPCLAEYVEHTQQMIAVVDDWLLHEGHVEAGDSLVFLAGMPSNRPGTTNTLRLHRAGDSRDLSG
jgi:pyruvate kinase